MFTKGFEKTAFNAMPALQRAGQFAMKQAKNPAVIRNAAIGAGGGAIAGAANNENDRLGGGLKGAVLGGLAGGAGTIGAKGFKANQKLQGIKNTRMTNMYKLHGQGD